MVTVRRIIVYYKTITRVIYDNVTTISFVYRWNTVEMEGLKAGRIGGKLEGGILLFQFVDFGSNRVELILQLILPTLCFPQVSGQTQNKPRKEYILYEDKRAWVRLGWVKTTSSLTSKESLWNKSWKYEVFAQNCNLFMHVVYDQVCGCVKDQNHPWVFSGVACVHLGVFLLVQSSLLSLQWSYPL